MRLWSPDRRAAILAGLHAAIHGCGALPLIGFLGLAVLGWAAPRIEAAHGPRPALIEADLLDADGRIIDEVLSRRAPGLGLTLRRQLGAAVASESKRAGYDPLLILALIDVESDFLEDAVSSKGARGLMQVKPSTLHFLAAQEGLRLTPSEVASDPTLSVRLGIRYLRDLQTRFGGDLDLALMAYNAGPTRIRKALRAGEDKPFRRYPAQVRREFRRFREGQGLGGDWALAQRASEVPEGAEVSVQ